MSIEATTRAMIKDITKVITKVTQRVTIIRVMMMIAMKRGKILCH
jgi:hypothetical protein